MALLDHQLEFDPRLVEARQFRTGRWAGSHRKAVEKGRSIRGGVRRRRRHGDRRAAALNQAGLRVPEDVALVGFDDILPSRYLNPPLTTVRAPTEQVGQEAVKQLVRRIHTGQADAEVLLPTELVIRQSCGCK